MGFAVDIMSKEEALKLPPSNRPLNLRLSSAIYHAVFETVGAASMCWKPQPTGEFDSSAAERHAVTLCLKIADDLERAGITYESSPKFFE